MARVIVALLLLSTLPAPAADIPFRFDPSSARANIWGGRDSGYARTYFPELLPAVFERTLEFDALELEGGTLEWIFTGPRGGVTVQVTPEKVRLLERYYDSPGLVAGEAGRHPERITSDHSVPYGAPFRTLAVRIDHRMKLAVLTAGTPLLEQTCLLDLSRHQLTYSPAKAGAGRVSGHLRESVSVRVQATVLPHKRHQTMLGFGGITTPAAYAQLSEEGKRRWWQLLRKYNLLLQREYPIGARLNPAMDNWDRLADASPHYYGDNFPNGEVSDFAYIRQLRRLGGKVLFEFWQLPPWARTDPAKYAQAVVRYCQLSRERAGAPPDIAGIQNEIIQPPEVWEKMTFELRRALDAAGFQSVRIHMADAGTLREGLASARKFRALPKAWPLLDYSATHMYDYQRLFTDPDQYDAPLAEWKQVNEGKPFLSTELCINDQSLQTDSYRVALAMAQLYHKNLEITDACAIIYCWLLLNVEQPSYGWTRTLFVPDPKRGFLPAASSCQLRAFGAFSRGIREGMVRLEVERSNPHLLITAFEGPPGARTVIALNRSTIPMLLDLNWPGRPFRTMEVAGPYQENEKTSSPRIEPGAILTLTTEVRQ